MAEKQLGAQTWGATDTLNFSHGPEVYGPSWMPTGYLPGNYYAPNYLKTTSNGTATQRNAVLVFPWAVTSAVTIDRFWVEIIAPNTVDPSAFFRPLIFEHDRATSRPKITVLVTGGRISTGTGNGGDTTYTAPGCYEVAVGPVTLSPGAYWIGGVFRSSSGTASGTLRGGGIVNSTFPMLVSNAANPGNPFVSAYFAASPSDPVGNLSWSQGLPFAWPGVGVRVAP